MALDLLTNVYSLPRDRLYFTYFEGNEELYLAADEETREIWLELGWVPYAHFGVVTGGTS